MTKAKICDKCKGVFREEGKSCKPDEITFNHKIYHLGDGMYSPWKEINGEFCSKKCFDEWYAGEYVVWFKKHGTIVKTKK